LYYLAHHEKCQVCLGAANFCFWAHVASALGGQATQAYPPKCPGSSAVEHPAKAGGSAVK